MKWVRLVSILILVAVATVLLSSCVKIHKLKGEPSLSGRLESEGYELKWSDEFDSDRLDLTKWKSGYSSPARRGGYYLNDDETVFVSDGALHIRTRYLENGVYGAGWYTGWLESSTYRTGHNGDIPDGYGGFSAKYGYFEIRCICPSTVGIWSAFWLMPDNGIGMQSGDVTGTGSDGVEIDVMESAYMYKAVAKDRVTHVLHGDGYGENAVSESSDFYRVGGMYEDYHTYGVLWTETEYTFYIDGIQTWQTDFRADGKVMGVSDVEQYMLLTVEVAGYTPDGNVAVPGDSWCGDPADNDFGKYYDFKVDYVRYYSRVGV